MMTVKQPAYYPEASVLVPVASMVYTSNTSTLEFVIVTIASIADAFVKRDGSTQVVAADLMGSSHQLT